MLKTDRLDEGNVGSGVISLGILLGLLTGVSPAFSKNVIGKFKDDKGLVVSTDKLKDIIFDETLASEKFGEYTADQIVNVVARTIYSEARNQSLEGKKAIMSVIWNRAGGRLDKFVEVCFAKKQFSWWWFGKSPLKPSITKDGFSPNSYVVTLPKTLFNASGKEIVSEKLAWEASKAIVVDIFKAKGNFVSNIGLNNMIGSQRDNKLAKTTWGTACNKKIGDHCFGYEISQDGFIKYGKTPKEKITDDIYVIKAGDTLGKIAKKFNVSTEYILTKNKNLTKSSIIYVGKKIKL